MQLRRTKGSSIDISKDNHVSTIYCQQNLKLQHLKEECIKKEKNFLEKTSTIPTRKPYQQKEEPLGKGIRKNEDCRINRRVIIIP